MGHELLPKSGVNLSASQVAERLRREFRHVVVDHEAGRRQARAQADWIESANPRIFLGQHDRALARAQRLRMLSDGDAAAIVFGDTPERSQQILILPDERIRFGYRGMDDELASRELVRRCARALDCDVEEF